MNIKGIIGSIFIGAASLLPESCYKQESKDCWQSRKNLLEEVISGKSKAEQDVIKANISVGDIRAAQMQHCIDSIVFRDMFQASQLAEEADFLAEYNKLMAKTKTIKHYSVFNGDYVVDKNKAAELLSDILTNKEMKNLMKSPVLSENGGNGYWGTDKQYLLDSVYHHKLFGKYNLLDKEGLKKFKSLCRKVRP